MQKVILQSMIVICVVMGLRCKDLGDAVPPPPLVFNASAVSVAVGNTAPVKISGGTRPYSIVSNSDAAKVIATVSNDTLQLRGLASGNATIVVGDNGSPRQTSSVTVTIVLLSVGQNVFNFIAGDTASTTLNGGTPPYSFVSRGDTTKVLPAVIGSTLTLRSLAAGSSTITIGDASSPRLTVTVNATVIAAVSFSAQVQPIFTASCAVTGCHIPGGNGPMSMEASVSRGNLVGVDMRNSACGGKRVVAGDANASGTVKKLEGTTCGNRMPLGGSALPTAQIDVIRTWINQGARNN
jgi:hypothetical protein